MIDPASIFPLLKSAAATITKVITEKVAGRLLERFLPAKKEALTSPAQKAQTANTYAQEVGGRVRFIRERLLGFSQRQMCEKLNIESVTRLEKYEAGAEEIPIHITRQIEQEYDIDPAYLDGKTSAAFTRFAIDKDTMIEYLRQGFTPVITTIPRPLEVVEKLYCYITFEKREADFTRHAVGMFRCSFSSHGGGKANLHKLIYAMLDLNMNPSSVWVVMATWFSWEAIENGTYASETSARIGRKADYDCLDIWAQWCEQVVESRDNWRRMNQDPMMELIANPSLVSS